MYISDDDNVSFNLYVKFYISEKSLSFLKPKQTIVNC